MSCDQTIEERVTRGAEFLDQHAPAWRKRVDPQHLEMSSSRCCVLGQTFGLFSHGRIHLGVDLQEAEALGFVFLDAEECDPRYEELGAEWRRVLECR